MVRRTSEQLQVGDVVSLWTGRRRIVRLEPWRHPKEPKLTGWIAHFDIGVGCTAVVGDIWDVVP